MLYKNSVTSAQPNGSGVLSASAVGGFSQPSPQCWHSRGPSPAGRMAQTRGVPLPLALGQQALLGPGWPPRDTCLPSSRAWPLPSQKCPCWWQMTSVSAREASLGRSEAKTERDSDPLWNWLKTAPLFCTRANMSRRGKGNLEGAECEGGVSADQRGPGRSGAGGRVTVGEQMGRPLEAAGWLQQAGLWEKGQNRVLPAWSLCAGPQGARTTGQAQRRGRRGPSLLGRPWSTDSGARVLHWSLQATCTLAGS